MHERTGLLEQVKKGIAHKYEVQREIGRGGMATVFLARDIAHNRPVAIKVLHGEVAATVSTERFLREIRLVASLQHPHILPLHDSGSFDGIPYFVMPFVSGESLRDRLDRDKTMSVRSALLVASEAASALDYAHRQGVVHRDIKPENLLLSDDHVLIADFGIARAAANSAGETLTATSTVIGTAAYMSPEQAAGEKEIDGRSDIYSLGCVLFECLAGKSPFSADSAAEMIGKRFAGPPPRLLSTREGIPRAVDSAVAAALSLSPDDRPASASAFAAMLTNESLPPGPRSSRKLIYASAFAALILIVAAVLLLPRRSHNSALDGRSSVVVSQSSVAASHGGTTDRTAHELYLQGRANYESLSPERIKTAGKQFQAAIDRDSLYADAWAGLADIHTAIGIGNYSPSPPRPEFEQARFAARRALSLDSTLAEAHASMAVVEMMYDYDWRAAERSLDKAQNYDPGYENAYLYRSFLLGWLGHFDSANAVSRQASHMNPSSPRLHLDIGRTLIQAHRLEDAERELQADVKLDPGNGRGRLLLGEALMTRGKLNDAVRELDEAQRLLPSATRVTAFRLSAYQAAGRHREAQHLLDSLVTLSDRSFVPAVDIAIGYAGMGDRDQTLTWLENSYTDRTLRPFFRDPIFDFVKSTPRFRSLLSKLHLEP